MLHIQSQYNHMRPYYRRQTKNAGEGQEMLQKEKLGESKHEGLGPHCFILRCEAHSRRWQECPLGGVRRALADMAGSRDLSLTTARNLVLPNNLK